MGYRVLGYLVWRGGKWYIRRRVSGGFRKTAAFGVLGAALIGGAVAVQRAAGRDNGSS